MTNRLRWDVDVAPMAKALRTIGDDRQFMDDFQRKNGLLDILGAGMAIEEMVDAQRFDCRSLNAGFVLDSGAERLEELRAGGQFPMSPFPNCVFEFGDRDVTVSTASSVMVDADMDESDVRAIEPGDGNQSLEIRSYSWPATQMKMDDLASSVELRDLESHKQNNTDAYHIDDESLRSPDDIKPWTDFPFTFVNCHDEQRLGPLTDAALLVLGMFTLLEESLVTSRQVSVRPEGSEQKLIRNGLRVNGLSYRIITLNLAEAHRRTRGVALHAHESPMLHWRRGSWHTLYRGSEFEKRVWHRRCLVGDPDKGFVSKHYRAVWSPTIH